MRAASPAWHAPLTAAHPAPPPPLPHPRPLSQQVEELDAAAEAGGPARPVILLKERRKRDRRTETNYLVTLQGHAAEDGEW